MSQHRHADDEGPLARAEPAPRADEPVVSAADLLTAAGRSPAPRAVSGASGASPTVARAIGGLHAAAGNGAVAWLLGGARAPRQRASPSVQREGDEGATSSTGPAAAGGGDGATELAAGAPPANPSWTKVGPPTNTTYAVSGSLRTVATAIGARTEAGSVTVTPGWQPQTWTPDGGTEEVISAQVTVGQVVELPVWSDKSSATKNQQKEWDRFHAAITTHEAGHVGKDVAAYKGVHSSMLKKTESAADAELDTTIAQAKTDNSTYDTTTASGINQGTGINPNIDEVTKVP